MMKKILNKEIKQFCYYFNLIGNIKKLKNGKILFFTISTILFEEKHYMDFLDGSFYERDCEIFLNIYSYENKELSLIYKYNYSQHYVIIILIKIFVLLIL